MRTRIFLHLHLHHCVHIIAEQIPRLSRTLHLDFQTIPGPNLFSRTFQVLETLQTQFQDFPGGVGARLSDGSRLRRQHQCCDRRSIDALLLPCVLFVVVVHTDSCRQLLTDCGEQWYPLVNTTALQHLVTPSRSAPTVTMSTTRYSMDSERPQHCCPLASNFEYITHNAGTSQYISLKALLHEVDFDPPPPQLILGPQGQTESTS